MSIEITGSTPRTTETGALNRTSSAEDYQYSEGFQPHTTRMLKSHVLRYAAAIGAKSAIDLGCGTGAMLRELTSICPFVVGVDPSDSGIREAQRNCPNGRFYNLGIYDSPAQVAESEFDLAVSTEVIEHLFYPKELAKFAHAKLRPGGLFVVSTPYHGWLKNVAIAVLNKWDRHHTVSWDGGHIKFWSRRTLGELLESCGFDVIGFHGCGRAPYLWESMIVVGRKRI